MEKIDYEKIQEWMSNNGKKWMTLNTALFIVILIIVKICFMIDSNSCFLFLMF